MLALCDQGGARLLSAFVPVCYDVYEQVSKPRTTDERATAA